MRHFVFGDFLWFWLGVVVIRFGCLYYVLFCCLVTFEFGIVCFISKVVFIVVGLCAWAGSDFVIVLVL